ncbi:hypothetical protein [Paraburkholderia atlantica]|nr:hypothetical protein [Paraburkholderia atlantica]
MSIGWLLSACDRPFSEDAASTPGRDNIGVPTTLAQVTDMHRGYCFALTLATGLKHPGKAAAAVHFTKEIKKRRFATKTLTHGWQYVRTPCGVRDEGGGLVRRDMFNRFSARSNKPTDRKQPNIAFSLNAMLGLKYFGETAVRLQTRGERQMC